MAQHGVLGGKSLAHLIWHAKLIIKQKGDDFVAANERLARKLLELGHSDRPAETVLDIAHGAGESLCQPTAPRDDRAED